MINSVKSLETAADAAYGSAISFARAFEGARELLVSLNLERMDGKAVLFFPSSYQMRLSLTNLIEDHAVSAAGMNTLAFVLLLQLQQRHLNLMQLDLVQQPQYPTMPSGLNSSSVLQSFFPMLYSRQSCFLDVELDAETVSIYLYILLNARKFKIWSSEAGWPSNFIQNAPLI